ncbi:hypothetical protein [uncultured Polaribacter sp.]|uniref:hypothetical protein n=1 Tax=uncultured Polaribacter sp. TaxID=174711 RepID=UPI00261AD7B1|nr:hypothetical protein [uncultured Polaribacter sp.]
MKKIILIFGFVLAAGLSINAQDRYGHSIGLRFASGDGAGGEISYQKFLGENQRLEIDLGLANTFANFKATGLYQWGWVLEEPFIWYAGVGAGIVHADGLGVFGAGVIGIEYSFNIPLLLSLDYRPEVAIAGGLDGLNSNIALSVRYQF